MTRIKQTAHPASPVTKGYFVYFQRLPEASFLPCGKRDNLANELFIVAIAEQWLRGL
jgi:hypothetical protein